MRHLLAAVGSAAFLLSTAPAFATVRNFTANLNSYQEMLPAGGVVGAASTATGTGTVTIDDVTGVVTVSGTFNGLTSPSSNCHVHGLSPFGGPSAPVLFPLTFTTGVTSGTFSGTGTLTGANLTAALNSQTYINVHSTMFPSGEIRGQIMPVPGTPAMPPWGLAVLALSIAGAGVLFVARRRGMAAEG
jgi:hypothetical protein